MSASRHTTRTPVVTVSSSVPRIQLGADLLHAAAGAAFGSSLLFDVASQFTDPPCYDFAGPARWLQGVGLLSAAAALAVRAGMTAGARQGVGSAAVRRLVALDVAALGIAVSWLARAGDERCTPVASVAFVATLVGVAVWWAVSIGEHPPSPASLARTARLTGTGALAVAVVLDLMSQVEEPSRLPRGAFWVVVVALCATIVGVVLGLRDAFSRRLVPLLAGSLVAAGASLAVRSGGDYTRPVSWVAVLLLAGSLVAAVAAARVDGAPAEEG